MTTIGHLHQIAGLDFKDVYTVAERLGLKSCRIVTKELESWRSALTIEEKELLEQYSKGYKNPDCNDPFPELSVYPVMGESIGMLLNCENLKIVDSEVASGKELYKNCVKVCNNNFLNNRCDTPWREVLKLDVNEKPEWRVLYKSPLIKKNG